MPRAADAAQIPPFRPSIVGLSVVREGAKNGKSLAFEIGDVIDVTLAPGSLAAFQAGSKVTGKQVGLALNGHFMTELPPVTFAADEIGFGPISNGSNKTFWNELWGGRLFSPRPIAVAVELEDGSIIATSDSLLTAEPLRGVKAASLVIGGLFFLVATLVLAVRSRMLRDPGATADGKRATYSLGRTQMAFWFVNVVLALLLIWALTGSVPPITTSVLGLLGIGAGTALGAALVDQGSDPTVPKASSGFLSDILTDGGGIALHRFQMMVWTLVLFFIFWGTVWNGLALPDFDTTLLALLGISSGAYLGFKFPENQKPSPQKDGPASLGGSKA